MESQSILRRKSSTSSAGPTVKTSLTSPRCSLFRLVKEVSVKLTNMPLLYDLEGTKRHHDQGSHGDWQTWEMKMVMEKSWNMKNWPKIMEFCAHSWRVTNFASQIVPNLDCLATIKKLSSDLESPHFPTFFRKTSQMQNREEIWSWKSHGQIFFQVCGNPDDTIGSHMDQPFSN